MKNSVVLPALFLFYFVITLTGLSLLSLLQHLGRHYSGEGTFVLGWLPSSIRSMLPAAVFLSLFFLFFRMLKKPGSRLLTFVLMLVTVAAALVGGNMGLHQILIVQPSPPLTAYLAQRRFHSIEDRTLYLMRIDDWQIRGLFTIDSRPGDKEWAMHYYPGATGRLEQGSLILEVQGPAAPGDTGRRFALPGEGLYAPIFRPSRFLAGSFRDYELIVQDFIALAEENSVRLYLLGASLAFVLLGTGMFTRITRWPFFNLLCAAAAMRGCLFLYGAVRQGLLYEWSGLVSGSVVQDILPSLVLMGVGLILHLVDLLFVPYDLWQRVIDSE